ncbi:zinc finger protein 280C isoform X2 [Genypterus blacodes]|uniref:zinc finger protein 280C isoform X2 n=1 Tax=Genypterus blacodes TaxID=154954 RepID=UPI003F75FE3C
MSELFMECVEEELEPWQKQVPQVQLVEDDDDEPIFVGVLSNNQKSSKPEPPALHKNHVGRAELPAPAPQPVTGPSQIMLPLNMTGNTLKTATSSVTTVTPQPVIVNNQGFIVTSPQLANSTDFIASLGSQYPPGTSFTIVPAGQQQILQQLTPGTVIPGVIHRPQVQHITNNVVTLSNVQSPTVYCTQSNHLLVNSTQPVQTFALPFKTSINNKDQNSVKRMLTQQPDGNTAKRGKFDSELKQLKTETVENGMLTKKCPKCREEFLEDEAMQLHMMGCCANLVENTFPSSVSSGASKRIMLVSDFYYGRFEGDGVKKEVQKTNTFKCQSCLKVLKNNIRFMNHMKHHLELEKQNSESWESHTTCQHCYRQYMTPFQLQCHIESAHSPIESSTNCKICELAFESEQVLLEHMKNNHKPGEMPYICQVCNYRSSFFSDVETHFRSVHENTKDLLCPFCLKVLRSGHVFMQHYMKHQKKGINRCGKCRLNFLTYKEKLEHRTHGHKTFQKPPALEGLPPGTKVTIRASLTGKNPSTPNAERSGFTVTPESPKRLLVAPKAKANTSTVIKAKTPQNKKQNGHTSKHNLALRNLSVDVGRYTCIECDTKISDFFSHFPMISNCGACKYRTSCKVSIGNHMIRFHSSITKNRFLKMENRKYSNSLKLTLVCLNCDLLVDASGGDLMSKHLTDRPNHVCRIIQEKDGKAKEPVRFMGQQAKVLYILTPVPVQVPTETVLQVGEGVTPADCLTTVDQTKDASETKISTAGQETESKQPKVTKSSEMEGKQPSPSLLSSSAVDEKPGNTESPAASVSPVSAETEEHLPCVKPETSVQ